MEYWAPCNSERLGVQVHAFWRPGFLKSWSTGILEHGIQEFWILIIPRIFRPRVLWGWQTWRPWSPESVDSWFEVLKVFQGFQVIEVFEDSGNSKDTKEHLQTFFKILFTALFV